MASSIIWGKYLVTRAHDDSSDILTDGAIYQQDGTIVDAGPYQELKAQYRADEILGGEGFLVIPGLVNAHHHGRGISQFMLGGLDNMFEFWFTEGWLLKGVNHYLNTLYASIRLVRSGVTTVMYNHVPGSAARLREACREALKAFQTTGQRVAFSVGIRSKYLLVYEDDEKFLSSLPADLATRVKALLEGGRITPELYFAIFEELHREAREDTGHRVNVLIAPTNAHWTPDELLLQMREEATRFRTGIHIHLVETAFQKKAGLRLYGETPLQHLDTLGFLGPDVSLAHGVWLNAKDIEVMADRGVILCHNPSSNLRLKGGISPVAFMARRGITVAIGTDSNSINEDEDLLMEMRLAHRLHRPPGVSSPSLTSHQVLKMATVNGAKATMFDDVGALEKGKRADAVLVRLEGLVEPYLDPNMSIVDALVYRAKASDVDTVVIGGRPVLKGGRFVNIDEASVVQELKKSLDRPYTRSEQERISTAKELIPYVQRFYDSWEIGEAQPFYGYNSRT